MAKAVKRPPESWIYVLKADRALPERERSVFTLSPMTYAERAAVRDDMARSSSTVNRTAGELALAHIVSIMNFPAGETKAWPADHDARVAYLELLDDDAVVELGDEIWARSALGYRDPAKPEQAERDGDQIKNSSTPAGTSPSGELPTTMTSSMTAAPANATPT